MYSIRHEYIQFCDTVLSCNDFLKEKNLRNNGYTYGIDRPKTVYIKSCGAINTIWQSWNRFWRIYWLTYIFGGVSYAGRITPQSIRMTGLQSINISEGQGIYYLLNSSGFDMRRYRNSIVRDFQEPTWGDVKNIEKIALRHRSVGEPGDRVLNALSVCDKAALHFQLVRNCSIHMTRDGIMDLKSSILPDYKSNSFKYPSDILFFEKLNSNKIALVDWTEELITLLELV